MDERYIRRHREELNASSSVLIPVCIVVDISGSMTMSQFRDFSGKTRIERLKEGLVEFFDEIRRDEFLSDSIEVAIVAFNDNVYEVLPFSTVNNIDAQNLPIPECRSSGDTPKGVEAALDLLGREKLFLEANNKNYRQPWIVIMSDGRATPKSEVGQGKDVKRERCQDIRLRLGAVQSKVKEMESNGKLTVIPVLISEMTNADGTPNHKYNSSCNEMKGFTAENRCKEIGSAENQESFRSFFKILSRSVSKSDKNLMFAGNKTSSAPQKPKKHTESDGARDPLSALALALRNEQAQRTKERVSSVSDEPVVVRSKKIKNEDADEVVRLKSETSISNGRASVGEDDYDVEMSEIFLTATRNDVSAQTSTVTKVRKTDDKYIESLIASIDDWDLI